MASRLILIETSTALCSAALAENGGIVAERRSSEPRAHASLTAPFVASMLDECGWKVSGCDAVCVGMGPGSYTGLRVGVSTAKGLCFGGDVPLLAVDTLETLYWQGKPCIPDDCEVVIPMVDARRMEVYTCRYSPDGERLTEIKPFILESVSRERALIVGDAAEKAVPFFPNATAVQAFPAAAAMLEPAMHELQAGNFRDVAYFEPFYLKEFIATVPRKKLF